MVQYLLQMLSSHSMTVFKWLQMQVFKQLFNQVVQLEIKIQLIYVMKKISLWYLADIDTLDTRRLI